MQSASAVVRLVYFTVLIYWWWFIVLSKHVLFFNFICSVWSVVILMNLGGTLEWPVFVPCLGLVICIKNNSKIQGEGLRAVEEILKPPGSLLATDRSKAVVLV